jgi:phosphoglycerol transferase MdoB-like AlkP superfamily enzyme
VTKPQGYWQSAAEAAFYALALCLPYYKSLLLAGIGRSIFVFLLACLLMFLVVRSTDICRLVTAFLMAFVSCLAPVRDQEFRAISFVSLAIPKAPSRSPLFERPPPLFS